MAAQHSASLTDQVRETPAASQVAASASGQGQLQSADSTSVRNIFTFFFSFFVRKYSHLRLRAPTGQVSTQAPTTPRQTQVLPAHASRSISPLCFHPDTYTLTRRVERVTLLNNGDTDEARAPGRDLGPALREGRGTDRCEGSSQCYQQ